MRWWFVSLAMLGAGASSAPAGRNAGASLLVDANPAVVHSSGAVPSGRQDSSEDEPTCELPATVSILPNNFLILQSGEDSLVYTDTQVSLSLDTNSRILINGRRLSPDPSETRREFSDSEVRSVLASVSYVTDLVESGMSWNEAGWAYFDSVQSITEAYSKRWVSDLREGVSFEMAGERLLASYHGHSFVDAPGTYLDETSKTNEIVLTAVFVGRSAPVMYWLHYNGVASTAPSSPGRQQACVLLAQLREVLEHPTGVNAIRVRDGSVTLAVGQESVRKLIEGDRK